MNIGTVKLGTGPCKVIAELSNAHNQNLDRCLRLMDAAQQAGADLLKIQLFTPDELIALRGDGPAPKPWDAMTMRELYTQAQTPPVWLKTLFPYAARHGMTLFSSVFGAESLKRLEAWDCPAYKLAALDREADDLLELVWATGKPVLRSWPDFIAPSAYRRDAFLYCPPGYPQIDLKLANLRNGYLGLSYHGQSYVEVTTAVAVGAKVVEIHCMPEDGRCLEAHVSWTPSRLRKLVDAIRETEILLG